MAKTPDFAKTFQDMMANFPIDTSSFQEAFKSQGVLGEKLARVALTAAERSTEISAQWAKDAIARVGELAAVKQEPADYAKSLTDFASASAEVAAEHMAGPQCCGNRCPRQPARREEGRDCRDHRRREVIASTDDLEGRGGTAPFFMSRGSDPDQSLGKCRKLLCLLRMQHPSCGKLHDRGPPCPHRTRRF